MYLGTNRIAGKVNGTSTPERHEREFLNFESLSSGLGECCRL
jgi:hypothetical protein